MELWLATENEHKKEEIQAMLEDEVEIKTLKDLEEPLHIVEDGNSFYENALIKAKALYEKVKAPVLADDSGLEVEAMNWGPGIYSSRWLGSKTPYSLKNQALIDLVDGTDRSRKARYVCDLVYINKDGKVFNYEGIMNGLIHDHPEGENGFGYDPVFYYPPLEMTNAQMEPDVKNRVSHRAIALQQFARDQFLL